MGEPAVDNLTSPPAAVESFGRAGTMIPDQVKNDPLRLKTWKRLQRLMQEAKPCKWKDEFFPEFIVLVNAVARYMTTMDELAAADADARKAGRLSANLVRSNKQTLYTNPLVNVLKSLEESIRAISKDFGLNPIADLRIKIGKATPGLFDDDDSKGKSGDDDEDEDLLDGPDAAEDDE